MENDPQSRKWIIIQNNPIEHGYDHEKIKKLLMLSNPDYMCLGDEIGEQETYHTHAFFYSASPVRFSTLKKRFPTAHIEKANGTAAQNREYIRKEGIWANSEKAKTSLPDTFEEYGTLPTERQEKNPEFAEIIADLESGKTTSEIVKSNPKLALRTSKIDELRETLRSDRYAVEKREIEITYIYAEIDIELIDYVFSRYPAKDICRVVNYGRNGHINFDNYRGQDILVFDNFKSSIPVEDMNVYCSPYPCDLPARYSNRTAAYTKIFILSYLPLEKQYSALRGDDDFALRRFFLRSTR